jgi:hypothetical protein
MGSSQSTQADNSTINWDNIKTDNISATIPSYNNLSQDAKSLISNLDMNSLSESSSVNITELLDGIHSKLNIKDKSQFTNMLNEINNMSEGHNESATSPFMSKEDYNKYLNATTSENIFDNKYKHQPNPAGKMVGGNDIDDNSSTSSTSSLSSSSSSSEEPSSHENPKHAQKKHVQKKHVQKKNKTKHHKGGSSENDSYISSSAHTGGDSSEINNNIISPATEDINSVSSD